MDFSIKVEGAAGCTLEIMPDKSGAAFVELHPDVAWTPADLRQMATALEAAARMIESK